MYVYIYMYIYICNIYICIYIYMYEGPLGHIMSLLDLVVLTKSYKALED